MQFILHEPYDLSWPLSGRSHGKNMYYCTLAIYGIYGIETWEDNPEDTCDLCSGYAWRYLKLQVIVFFFVFPACMCTCLCVSHQCKKQAQRKTHIWTTIRKSILQAVKFSKILINLISQVQYPPLWWCWYMSYLHRISNIPPLFKE